MRDVLVRVVNEDYEELLPRITCPVRAGVGRRRHRRPAVDRRAGHDRCSAAR